MLPGIRKLWWCFLITGFKIKRTHNSKTILVFNLLLKVDLPLFRSPVPGLMIFFFIFIQYRWVCVCILFIRFYGAILLGSAKTFHLHFHNSVYTRAETFCYFQKKKENGHLPAWGLICNYDAAPLTDLKKCQKLSVLKQTYVQTGRLTIF